MIRRSTQRWLRLALVIASTWPAVAAHAQSAIPEYLKAVVSRVAPIIIHETFNNYPNVEARDHILPVDFDLTSTGADNYDNASTTVLKGEPTVYYAAIETGLASDQGYYFVGYFVYHPADGGAGFNSAFGHIAWNGHEHDMEGSYFVIKKNAFSPYGEIQVALTEAHGALIPYKKDGATYVGQNQPAGSNFMGYIRSWYDQTFATYRPVVAIRSRSHANYLAQDCSGSTPQVDLPPPFGAYGMDLTSPTGIYVSCIHSETQSIIYSPVPTNVPPSSGIGASRLGQDFRHGFAYYKLVELSTSPIWQSRDVSNVLLSGSRVDVGDGSFFGYNEFHQSGSDHGGTVDPTSTANPPWDWKGGTGECQSTPLGFACYYSFGADGTDVYYSRAHWPNSPSSGRLLGNPDQEILMRFPFLPELTQPIRYSPYGNTPAAPAPSALSITIGGPDQITAGTNSTWQALVGGGTGPYTYQWSGALTGNGETITGTLYSDDILYLDVWDAAGAHAAVSLPITVQPACPNHEVIC